MHGRIRAAVAAVGALGLLAAVPAAASAQGGAGEPEPYEMDSSAKAVKGASSSADGPRLAAGQAYKDALKPGDKKYYTVKLGSKTTGHVSAFIGPKPGIKTDPDDSFDITLSSTGGDECDAAEFTVSAENGYVLGGAVQRKLEEYGECNAAGVYNVLVTRDSAGTSDPAAWPLELKFMEEPALKGKSPSEGPDYSEFDEEDAPTPPSGTAKKIDGGLGFGDATGMSAGVWQDEIVPGETRFYRMPVDWGQQPFVTAEFGGSGGGDTVEEVSDGAGVRIYGPQRGLVWKSWDSYSGAEPAAATAVAPPVRYENRYDDISELYHASAAGWYYVAVTVDAAVGENVKKPVTVTLRNTIKGEPKSAPAYNGDLAKAGFGVTDADREAAEKGQSEAAAEASDSKMTVAYVGIGAGVVLLAALGAWMLLARRRGPVPAQVQPQPYPQAQPQPHTQPQDQTFGPPQSWQ
ncbi:hypothetical protein G5C51_08350 [Streptomyces sp. A7024]|uniref:Uncharacterized protein n=1 Tax=Streptomyces coryli TaxID=1128680 RepID=A0A6G4TVJ5_9ACTN|nr:hypothetical protein [Streptomyces coryli]NGN63914.1 hypothetical protein [Streptomyces coryli]